MPGQTGRHSRLDYRQLYRRSPVMMVALAADGTILTASDTWLRQLGYRHAEVRGAPISRFLGDEAGDTAEPCLARLGFAKDLPYKLFRRNGEALDVLLSTLRAGDNESPDAVSLAVMTDISERKQLEEERYQLAYFDQLTGKPNRFLFLDRLRQALAQGRRDRSKVALLFLDLDRFKWVNDTLGHEAGDTLLRIVAERLSDCVRKVDTVGRLGGDEFGVILNGVASSDAASQFARRIVEAVAQPAALAGRQFATAASLGIALYPNDGADAESLLRHADMAMYAAKGSGCGTFRFFSEEMAARQREKQRLEGRLRGALERREFVLHYQPQFDLRNHRITGLEALLRWPQAGAEPIAPDAFLPLAEETGLILPLGEWVLRTACTQAVAWRRAGLPPMRMAINLSARQLARPDFIEMIETIVAETGIAPEQLEIELSEKTVMDQLQDSIAPITDLKVRNIKLAIDDFGTGHSSLVYLHQFPFDRIKICQRFVRELPRDTEQVAIVKAILQIGRSLHRNVIAEGVEHQAQLDFLTRHHCHEMQGFFLAPPVPADRIPGLTGVVLH